MKALIIAAHGSRRKESNMEVASLALRVFEKSKDEFARVEHAFLQFSDPLIESKLDELVKRGADEIVIFPFFIGSGSHILVDIPKLVEKAQKNHPHVKIRVTRHLGKIAAIEDVILQEVGA